MGFSQYRSGVRINAVSSTGFISQGVPRGKPLSVWNFLPTRNGILSTLLIISFTINLYFFLLNQDILNKLAISELNSQKEGINCAKKITDYQLDTKKSEIMAFKESMQHHDEEKTQLKEINQRQEAELRELQMKLVNSENEKRLAEEAHQHALERERLLQQEKEKQANMLLMNQSANNPFNSMSMVQEQPPNFRAELNDASEKQSNDYSNSQNNGNSVYGQADTQETNNYDQPQQEVPDYGQESQQENNEIPAYGQEPENNNSFEAQLSNNQYDTQEQQPEETNIFENALQADPENQLPLDNPPDDGIDAQSEELSFVNDAPVDAQFGLDQNPGETAENLNSVLAEQGIASEEAGVGYLAEPVEQEVEVQVPEAAAPVYGEQQQIPEYGEQPPVNQEIPADGAEAEIQPQEPQQIYAEQPVDSQQAPIASAVDPNLAYQQQPMQEIPAEQPAGEAMPVIDWNAPMPGMPEEPAVDEDPANNIPVPLQLQPESESQMYQDCHEIWKTKKQSDPLYQFKNGVNTIQIDDLPKPLEVFCEFDSTGGWTRIQHRSSFHIHFNRTWDEYKWFFGNSNEDYWIGLEPLHYLTKLCTTYCNLIIELKTWTNEVYKIHFTGFYVENESRLFKLHTGINTQTEPMTSERSHGLAKAFSDSNDLPFTTKDRDNDKYSKNCADVRGGGWWYHHCTSANVNGKWYMYGSESKESLVNGIFWQGDRISARGKQNKMTLKEVTMKVQVP